jgi:DNA repair protein RadC
LEGFAEHEVLELLLFFAIPQKDTNELAHKLIKKFGSLINVLDAPFALLTKENGIGDSVATLIKLTVAIHRYCKSQQSNKRPFKSTKNIAEFMMSKFEGQNKEQFYVLCLDSCLNVTAVDSLFVGEVNTVNVSWRRIVQYVLANETPNVLLCHNHPTGLAIPSSNDVFFTQHLCDILKLLNVRIKDHIIISGREYASMKEMGLLVSE